MAGLSFSLRRQLTLVSLLLLTLPWAGCQFVREMEGALRQGQEQALLATARAVAAVAGERRELIYPDPARITAPPDERPMIYAPPAEQPVAVDGYAEGWEDVPAMVLEGHSAGAPPGLRAQAVTRGGSLFLLVQVRDPEVVYHNPGLSREPNGDRLVLRTWLEGRRQDYVIATAAPGSVRARAAGRRQRGVDPGRIRGHWQDAAEGYSLELELPLAMTGNRLGFYVVNATRGENTPVQTLGNIAPMETYAPPWLIYTTDGLQAALAPFTGGPQSIQVVDRDSWLVADLPAREARATTSETFWLLRLAYRSILAEEHLPPPPRGATSAKLASEEILPTLAGQPDSLRYRQPGSTTRTLLAATAPVYHDEDIIGAVVVRQSAEQYLSLTDQAFSRLLGYSLLAIGLGALGLLGYASALSYRVRQLNRAAHSAIASDGSVRGDFPRSRVRDELGELSRSYADLLDRLREYNDYLRTLSRKLSHELRTPIAVIKTSLENLEQRGGDGEVYLERAQGGLKRLNRILTAMSEASRLEESIRNNPMQTVDLVPLLREVHAAYESVYPNNTIALDLMTEQAEIQGVPELIVQALDKLMDNATSFSAPGTTITIALKRLSAQWQLSVSNEGPQLTPALEQTLFDPMVSHRQGDSGEVHLGLGLHVARLISDYHGGSVRATNMENPQGVRVTITLPASAPTPPGT